MANSKESTARERMKTIIQGVVSDPTRVILGLDNIEVNDPNFFDNLIPCGPKIYILGAEQDNLDAVNRLYTFSVKVRIYYGFVPNQDNEYKGMNDYVKPVWVALNLYSNYTDCLPPTSLNGFKKVSDVGHTGAVAGTVGCYEATYQFIAGSECD